MLTLTYDYGKVTSVMKVKLSVIVEEPKDTLYKKGPKMKVVDRSIFGGTEYFRVAPYPFLTIDISGAKDKNEDGRNPNLRVNVNRMYKHILTAKIRNLISCYTESERLFYYDTDGKLKMENSEAIKYVEEVRLQNGIVIRISPMIVYTDPEVASTACEGAYFMIDTPDNGCAMTFDELSGFYDKLTDINMDSMAMQLLMMYQVRPKDEIDDIPTVTITPTFPTRKPVSEEKPVDPPSSNTPAQVTKTIPTFE